MAIQLRDWLGWWVDVLVGIFGAKSRALPIIGNILVVHSNGISLTTSQSTDNGELLSVDTLKNQLIALRSRPEERYKPLTVRIDHNRAIVRQVASMSLPKSKKLAAATLDMENATPFTSADAHALLVEPENDDGGTYYAIVKRSVLDPLVDALNQTSTIVSAVHFAHNGRLFTLSSTDRKAVMPTKRGPIKRAVISTLAACGVVLVGTSLHYAYKFDVAIAKLEQSMVQLNTDAKTVRIKLDKRSARIAELQALRSGIEDGKPAVLIWEEIARILPDSSFLTDMTITQSKVSIAGYSQAAASIIVALEGSALFDEVAFSAPVVKVPGRSEDRFAIDLRIGVK